MEEDQRISKSVSQIVEFSLPPINYSPNDEDADVMLDFSELFCNESDAEVPDETLLEGEDREGEKEINCEGSLEDVDVEMEIPCEGPNEDAEVETEIQYEGENIQTPHLRHRCELGEDDRMQAYSILLQKSFNGKLNKTLRKEVALNFGTSPRSVHRLWSRGKKSGTHNVAKKRGNSGRRRVEHNLERVKDIPLEKRTTLRCISASLGMSTTTLFRRLEDKELRRHTNYVHPTLTESNRCHRIEHCLYMINPTTVPLNPHFLPLDNMIHIDEKWFFMSKKVKTIYMLPNEKDPIRSCKSTKFIPKIMFLTAVARPRYDLLGNCTFDGKIGIFAMIDKVAAARNSVNRPAGTIESKPISKIDRNVVRNFMITKLLPAIKEKWPIDSITKPIIIQQDNAKPHIYGNDSIFLQAAHNVGLDIRIFCQPPNSPDLNVLDLGFFRAIQSLQEKERTSSIDELIAAVEKSFNDFSVKKSNYIFITLQSCMIEVLRILGSNTYKIPHLHKERLDRLGNLPTTLSCDPLIIDAAIAHLPH